MDNRHGLSVVEVLVALVVFSVAALGSAAALGLASRVQREAIARRVAVNAAELRMASHITTPCDSIAAGTVIVGSVPVVSSVFRTDSLATITVHVAYKGTSTTLRSDIACE